MTRRAGGRLLRSAMTVQTINCPACGAPAPLDATQCSFCHATIATVACPSCFGLMIAGAEFCSHCGAKAQRTDSETSTPLPCPHCKSPLNAVQVGQAHVHDCATCGGVWLNIETFRQIAEDRDAQSGVLAVLAPTPPTMVPSAADIHYVPCPICAKLMNRLNFARISGIVLDSCKPHGTWFDRDELRRIIEFVRAGGLAAARSKEMLAIEEQRRLLDATRQYAAAAVSGRSNAHMEHNEDLQVVSTDLGKVLTTVLGWGFDLTRNRNPW